jgi:hypothetical protein
MSHGIPGGLLRKEAPLPLPAPVPGSLTLTDTSPPHAQHKPMIGQ